MSDRLNDMNKEHLINLIKEIKITCESNRSTQGATTKDALNFILRLINGKLGEW